MCCTGIAANLKVNGQIMSNPSLGLDIRALNCLFLFTYLALITPAMTVVAMNDSSPSFALSTL